MIELGRIGQLTLAALLCVALPTSAQAQSVDYASEVRPILADHCFACHGPDSKAQRPKAAPLRLDKASSALADRGGYAAIVAGDPGASEALTLVREDHEARMPPAESGRALNSGEIEILERWIAEGAAYQVHWAYEPPKRPEVPTPHQQDWAYGELDAFVQAGLEREGLRPAPPADARTRVRRLSFDLLGLPPTQEQVTAVAADPSGQAWNALVEQFLASPQHAERLTTFWFDLVRFADTTGIHADNTWNIAPYRDWVLAAFASNMPFDRFTREQLAGDLLPEATDSSRIASAYNRLNLITREGGSQPKEFLARYTADRVRNASEVWLATTLGCAECHDHKFDPLSARDFYSFGAFFADIEQAGVYSESSAGTFKPELEVPSADQAASVTRITSELASLETLMALDTDELRADQARWESALIQASESWQPVDHQELSSETGTTFSTLEDGSFLATGKAPDKDTYRLLFDLPTKPLSALRLELLSHASLPKGGPGRADNANLVLSEVELRLDGELLTIGSSRGSYEQPNYPLVNTHDGRRGAGGWAVMRDGKGAAAEAVFVLANSVADGGDVGRQLELTLHQDYGSHHTLGRWRVSWSSLDPAALEGAVDPDVRDLASTDAQLRTEQQRELLRARHRASTALLAPQRELRAQLQSELATTRAAIPLVLLTRAVEPMVTRVLSRGNWMDETGEVVQPAVPAALGALPPMEGRATRLDLANWFVSGENPLVARVLVNRLWRLLFGHGLVPQLDDFGVQGSPPSHPQLLDYLAAELVDNGWDVRHVLRLMLHSRAYAQSSQVGEDRLVLDPGNRWFGRQERFRLDAEFVRDNALAASGLLVRRLAGPSVRPYQPAGYYSHLNFPKRQYQVSSGEDLYRRSLYTHWQRQYLHPSLAAFDAPSRERCTAERSRSNTPLAALTLLNDPIFVEAARGLATKVLHEAGDDDQERANLLWRCVLQRDPNPAESRLALDLAASHLAHYTEHEEQALQLLNVGQMALDASLSTVELAAWTSVARVVLNLHETITRN
ncbi:MAG: mono/diheme cytochrome c family protein [Planctomycetota bacterium]|jgi:mono/diheme cytochrome c family protein